MNSGFDRVNSSALESDSKNRLLQVGAEEVRSSRLGQNDLGGSCLVPRKEGNRRLKAETEADRRLQADIKV